MQIECLRSARLKRVGRSHLDSGDGRVADPTKLPRRMSGADGHAWPGFPPASALLWNFLGCAFFGMELFAQEAAMESMTKPQKEWARSIPGWIYFVYGLAVSTGVAGSIGLFLRKGWTTVMFAICLVAVIVQMVYTMIIGGGLRVMGPSGLIMPVLVIGIAAGELWFSRFARSRGWLGQVSPIVERD